MIINRRRSGFAMLELLLVVVVLAIVTGYYFNRSGGSGQPDRSTYEMSVKRSQDTACIANRVAFRTTLEMFRMNNPSVALTTENLQKAGVNVPKCPEGGDYAFAADGNLICSRHPGQGTAAGAPGQLPEGMPGIAGQQLPAIPGGVPALK